MGDTDNKHTRYFQIVVSSLKVVMRPTDTSIVEQLLYIKWSSKASLQMGHWT